MVASLSLGVARGCDDPDRPHGPQPGPPMSDVPPLDFFSVQASGGRLLMGCRGRLPRPPTRRPVVPVASSGSRGAVPRVVATSVPWRCGPSSGMNRSGSSWVLLPSPPLDFIRPQTSHAGLLMGGEKVRGAWPELTPGITPTHYPGPGPAAGEDSVTQPGGKPRGPSPLPFSTRDRQCISCY